MFLTENQKENLIELNKRWFIISEFKKQLEFYFKDIIFNYGIEFPVLEEKYQDDIIYISMIDGKKIYISLNEKRIIKKDCYYPNIDNFTIASTNNIYYNQDIIISKLIEHPCIVPYDIYITLDFKYLFMDLNENSSILKKNRIEEYINIICPNNIDFNNNLKFNKFEEDYLKIFDDLDEDLSYFGLHNDEIILNLTDNILCCKCNNKYIYINYNKLKILKVFPEENRNILTMLFNKINRLYINS